MDKDYYFLDTNAFNPNVSYKLKDLLAILPKKYAFYVTKQIKDEIIETEFDSSLITILEVLDEHILNLQHSGSIHYPPQYADLSLLAGAEQLLTQGITKTVTIISSDYKLAQYLEGLKQEQKYQYITLLPVPVFCYVMAGTNSSHNKDWRELAKEHLLEYIEHNLERADVFDPKDILKWVFSSLGNLLSNTTFTNVVSYLSEEDYTIIEQLLSLHPKEDELSKRPYLSELQNKMLTWQVWLTALTITIPDPVTLSKEEFKTKIQELKKAVEAGSELLILSLSLSQQQTLLVRRFIFKRLLILHQALVDYYFHTFDERDLNEILVLINQYATLIQDMDALFLNISQTILYQCRLKNFDQALMLLKAAEPEFEHDITKNTQLVLLEHIITTEQQTKTSSLEHKEKLKLLEHKDSTKVYAAIKELGTRLFKWGFYTYARDALIYTLLHADFSHTKMIVHLYNQIILCDKITNNSCIKIREQLSILSKKSKEVHNELLEQFFLAERNRKVIKPTEYIWVHKDQIPYNNIPTFLKKDIKCLLADKQKEFILLETEEGLFYVHTEGNKLFNDMIIQPYCYTFKLKQDTAIKIMEPITLPEHAWLEGMILLQPEHGFILQYDT